ncbi:MAG TPA: hypothetical protein VM243_01305, partial [Phycisphaerae bacterium]|nr:hypothetical protein [Phycisphaerae bacterium]
DGNVTGSVGSLVGHTVQTGDTFALANGASGFVAIIADTAAILLDTGTTLPARFTGIEGATFLTATDSLEAIRNRGDAAWITGGGLNAAATRAALGMAAANLDTQLGNIPTVAEFNARTLVAASYSTVTQAQVQASVTAALTAFPAAKPTDVRIIIP